MEHKKRLIDLDASLKRLEKESWWLDEVKACIRMFLAKAKLVDAVEVVHGRWVEKEEKLWNLERPVVTGWECSECGVWGHYTYNYCPNCGAKMDGGKEDV